MATKKQNAPAEAPKNHTMEQLITSTLEENYMPYAMSVIISRAIPEIDGLKPSHRKLLYTMYKMNLLHGGRTKSANIVGQTMKLNPHGDAAIYDTMVRLSRGYGALLHPLVDSKGNFGRVSSRDMAYAAARYTEAKLDPICGEFFRDIDRETVDFIDNYDNTLKEPTLLPVTFPSVLVNVNLGIAVGMASNICSFNLAEVCDTTIELMKDPNAPLELTLRAPDFSTGAQLVYNKDEMRAIYETGRGGFKLRAKYNYDKKNNLIEITELPYTTTVEAVIDKLAEMIKSGRLKEVTDARDETDLSGTRLAIDLKRGVDPDKLMARLFKATTLQDTFSCNFNVLIGGTPKVLGVRELLLEWIAFRTECVRRAVYYDCQKKKEKLHLLKGLRKILLDIDKAVRIVRDTEEETEVVPNLMIGFGIDEIQAEYIAEIKLRHLNREYVLKRISEVDSLRDEIAELEEIVRSPERLHAIITAELEQVKKKFGSPRKTELVYENELVQADEEEPVEDYPVNLFFTREGYFKKITPLSLRMGGEHKLKEGDAIVWQAESSNKMDLLVFTDRCQVYKAHLYEFEDCKASVLGDYLPGKLGMDEGENARFVAVTADYKGFLLFAYADGRLARVDLSAYETKTNRKRLTGAYSDKSPLVGACALTAERDFVLVASNGKTLVVNSAMVPVKTTRSTQGVAGMTLKGKNTLAVFEPLEPGRFEKPDRYRTKGLPAVGSFLSEKDRQLADEMDQVTL